MSRLERSVLVVFAAVVLASIAALQVAHVRDKFQVTENAGTWMALADEAAHGTLYPPLFDGSHYGGTRYMPLPILAHAAAARATGDLILGGKLVAYAAALALAALILLALRRLDASSPVALALLAAVASSVTGVLGATSLHFDAPAVALQLGALVAVDRSRSTRAVTLAAVLCALALLAKLSAVWAVAAVALWLLVRERRKLVPFLAAYAGVAAAGLALAQLFSHGRMWTNLTTLTFSSYTGAHGSDEQASTLRLGVENMLDYLGRSDATPFLAALGLVATATALVHRRFTLYHLAFLVSMPVLVVVFGDIGADVNHLLDLAVLAALATGAVVAWPDLGPWPRRSLALAVVVPAVLSYRANVLPETKAAVRLLTGIGASDVYARQPLGGLVGDNDTMLSDDPYVPVSFGQRPVVLDLFMFLRFRDEHPEWIHALARRVRAHEFDKVVLTDPIEQRFRTGRFGLEVNGAIARSYRLQSERASYWVYVPRRANASR